MPYHSAVMLNALKRLKVDFGATESRSYRFESAGLLPLLVEVKVKPSGGSKEVWVTHLGSMNGDVMQDPGMVFIYTSALGLDGAEWLVPIAYRNDYMGAFDESRSPKSMMSRSSFADFWGKNIIRQRYEKA